MSTKRVGASGAGGHGGRIIGFLAQLVPLGHERVDLLVGLAYVFLETVDLCLQILFPVTRGAVEFGDLLVAGAFGHAGAGRGGQRECEYQKG